MTTRDPSDVLHDLALLVADDEQVAPDVRAIVRRALTDADAAAARHDLVETNAQAARRRRRRRIGIPIGVVIALGLGGGIAAAILRHDDVRRPDAGIVCRAEPSEAASAIVLPTLSDDPIGDCALLWREGRLPDTEDGAVNPKIEPELFACVGTGGAVEVYPKATNETCATLGLPAADIVGAVANPIVELQDRIVNEITNTCTPVVDAKADVQAILTDLGLTDWSVVVRDGDGPCARLGLDPDAETVFIVPGAA